MDERLYVARHRRSRFRGRTVSASGGLIRPRNPRLLAGAPNNVLCEDIKTGRQFVCPWRGLRRVKEAE